jgi:hypothetical protein
MLGKEMYTDIEFAILLHLVHILCLHSVFPKNNAILIEGIISVYLENSTINDYYYYYYYYYKLNTGIRGK